MIIARLIELGKPSQETAFENGATVRDLFEFAGTRFVAGCVTRDNQVVCPDTMLRDNDTIFSGSAMKGNLDPFVVKFICLGASNVDLPAQDGYSIKQTLEQLSDGEKSRFFHADGKDAYEYRIGDGRPTDSSATLSRPASGEVLRVVCAQKMKGNR